MVLLVRVLGLVLGLAQEQVRAQELALVVLGPGLVVVLVAVLGPLSIVAPVISRICCISWVAHGCFAL